MRLSDSHRAQWRREFAPGSAWAGDLPRRLIDLAAVVAIAAALVDGLVSYALLDGSAAFERNPLVAAVMGTVGVGLTLTLGVLLRLGIVLALAFLATRAVRPVVRYAATVTMGGVAVWWCLVVFLNAVVARRVTG